LYSSWTLMFIYCRWQLRVTSDCCNS
jgi:hypothetical protein